MRRNGLLLFFALLLCMSLFTVPHTGDLTTTQEPEKSFKVSTDYNTQITEDKDDCWWRYDVGVSWTIYDTNLEVYVTRQTDGDQDFGLFRFTLNILQGVTIDSANFTAYESSDDNADKTASIRRIDETNPGYPEDDTEFPTINNDTYCEYDFDGVEPEWGEPQDVTQLVQNQVNLGDWESGFHILFVLNFNESYGRSRWFKFEDYQAGTNNHAYLNISYTAEEEEALTWLNDFTHRKRVTIAQTEGADENHTVSFNVYKGTGSDSGNTTYFNDVLVLDGLFDVMFTDENHSLLDYWIEEYFYSETETEYFGRGGGSFGWYPYCYPNSYYYNNRTYISWQDAGFNPYIIYYDHQNLTWSPKTLIDNDGLANDNHGPPAMWVDISGFIHVVYGSHNDQFKHRVSTYAERIDAWSEKDDFGDAVYGGSYPALAYDRTNDVIHVWYRCLITGYSQIAYHNSTDNGDTWSDKQPLVFVDSSDYWTYVGEGVIDDVNPEIIHVVWSMYNTSLLPTVSYEDIVYLQFNATDGVVYNVTGDSQGYNVTIDEYDNVLVYDTEGLSVTAPNVKVKDGVPYHAFNYYIGSGDRQSTMVFWNTTSGAWDGPHDISVSDGMGHCDIVVYSSDNITAVSTDVFDMSWYTWDGVEWTKEDTIISSINDVLIGYPTVPVNNNDTIQFVITENQGAHLGSSNRLWAYGVDGLVDYNAITGAKMWVEVSTNLTEESATIYIYYGNLTAISGSVSFSTSTEPIPTCSSWRTDYLETTDEFFISSFSESMAQNTMFYVDDDDYTNAGNFIETFEDVTDWTSTGESLSTDGDVVSVEVPDDSAYDYYYSNNISLNAGYYAFSIRYKSNESGAGDLFKLRVWSAVDKGGSGTMLLQSTYPSTSWNEYVGYASVLHGIECVEIYAMATTDPTNFSWDFVRVGNMTGWSYDGSTTTHTTVSDGASVESDGEYLSMISDSGWGWVYISVDDTTSNTPIDTDTWFMIHLDFHDDDQSNYVNCYSYDGAAASLLWSGDTKDQYFNIRKGDDDITQIRFQVFDSETTRLNFIRIYNVFNWTLTNNPLSDYGYVKVENGALVSNHSMTNWLILEYEPTISVTTNTNTCLLLDGEIADQYFGLETSYYTDSWSSYSWSTFTDIAGLLTISGLRIRIGNEGILNSIYIGNRTETEGSVNDAPVNDATPVCVNIDDSTYLYAQYRQYQITANVSDANGYTDISTVDMTLYSNDRETPYWTLRYTQSTDTFSEQSDSNNMITLNSTGSSNSSAGNDIDLVFILTIHWNHTDTLNTDIRQYTVDDQASTDTDWYEVDYDIETQLDITSLAMDDNLGTIDRGDLDGTFFTTGTITYYDSSLNPASDGVDVWVSCSEYGTQTGPWSDLTLTSGAFNVTCYADDVVGLDQYTVKAVEEGAGSGDSDLMHDTHTDSYIADQIVVQITTADDTRLDINTDSEIRVTLWLDYDDSYLGSGDTVILNGTTMSWDSGNSWFELSRSQSSVDLWRYFMNSSYEATHGISSLDLNSQYVDIIWDRIIILTTSATDGRIDYGMTTIVNVTAQLEYDGHTLGASDTLYMNDTQMTWDTDHFYLTVGPFSVVDLFTFYVNSSSANEATYGITVVNLDGNDQDIIWDRIKILTTTTQDGRIDYGTAADIRVTAELEYDSHALGSGDTLYMDDSLMSWVSTYFQLTPSKSAVGLWNYFVNSSSANEATYGITVINLDSKNVDEIWDRIKILITVVDDGRLNINDNAEIRVTAELEYDSHALGTGDTLYIDDTVMVWDSGNSWFDLARTQSTVGLWNYFVNSSSANEATYGITVVNLDSNDVDIIFDRLVVDMQADDETVDNGIQVNFTLTVTFDYDDTTCTTYQIVIDKNSTWWYSFTNSNKTLFNDTNTDVTYNYTTYSVTSESLYGITAFTTNLETVVWSPVPNEIPVNDTAPVLTNPDDTDNIYAKYHYYVITSNVSDADGYADIDYIELSLWDDARGTELWRIRYTVSGSSFSVQLGSAYITLQYSSVVESGNDIDITWSIKIDWDHTDYTDIDTDQYVYDGTDSDQDWYESNWDTETRLDYSVAPYLSDDRGNINTADLQGDGTIIYYGSGDNYPLANETDVWILHDVSGTWSGDVGGSGAFTITSIGSSASVRLNTYTFKVVVTGDGSGGTDLYYTTSLTDTFITDRIQVQTTVVDDGRVDVDANAEIRVTLWLDYDDSYLGTGDSVTLDGAAMTWDSGNSWFDLARTKSTVGLWFYFVNSSSEATYGITALDLNSQDISVIFDRIKILTTTVDDSRVDESSGAELRVTAELEYDSHTLGSGDTLYIDDLSMTWDPLNSWFDLPRSHGDVGLWNYYVNSSNANEATYGITVVNLDGNDQDVIWDRINILVTVATDSRIDYGTTTTINVTAELQYDSHTLGSGDTLYMNDTSMTWDTDHFYLVAGPFSVVHSFRFKVNISSANEATYGITYVEINKPYDDVIWDRIKILTTTTQDGRIDYGTAADIRVTAELEYDSHALGSGDTLYMDDSLMSWVSTYFQLTPSKSAVGLWNYFVNSSSANEATYGITVVNLDANDVDQIWDRVQVQSYTVSDNHDNINDDVTIDVTLWYDYDDSLVTDGTVTINTISASHQGSGVWRITENEATVQQKTYDTVAASGNTHGITVVDQNGQSDSVIWDQIVVQTTVCDDSRVDINANSEIRVTLWLDFADEYLGTGDSVTLDGVAMSWDGGNSWFDLSRSQASVNNWLYYVNSSSEATYGITALDVNSQEQEVIWDRIIILTTTTQDGRINYDTQADLRVTAQLEYDSHALGTGDTLYMNDTSMSWVSTYFQLQPQFAQVGIWNFYINSSNANEASYGITVVNLDANNVDQIWDRLVINMQADLETPDNGQQVNFTLTVTFEYGGTCDTYQIVVNRSTVWWHSFTNANKTLFNDTNSDVSYDYSTYEVTSESTYGITVFTSNTETVTWSPVENNAPVNDTQPTAADLDDSNNLYAYIRFYTIIVYVSDLQGFADIDYLEFSLYSNDQGTLYWTCRYDEDTDTFSETYDPNNYIYLDIGASSAVESGDDIDATFKIRINWNHPDISETDFKCYVIDDKPESDTDWYENNWDYETRLDYSVAPSVTSDDAGTVDRGDLDEIFHIEGTIIYYGGTVNPTTAIVDVWISGSEYGTNVGPWSDLILTAGAFDVTCYADDAVGQDTYTIKIVTEGAGSDGTDLYYTTSATDTYIADSLTYTMWNGNSNNFPREAYDSGYPRRYLWVFYSYDRSKFNSSCGSVKVEKSTGGWYTCVYNTQYGYWSGGADLKSSSQSFLFDGVLITDTLHGLNSQQGAIHFDGNSDAITFALGAGSSDFDIGDDWTLRITFFPHTVSSGSYYVFSMRNWPAPAYERNTLYYIPYNTTHATLKFKSWTFSQSGVTLGYIAFDDWHVITLRMNVTTLSYWVDSGDKQTLTGSQEPDSDMHVVIGAQYTGSGNWFYGYIGEVMIWNTVYQDYEIEHGINNGGLMELNITETNTFNNVILKIDTTSINMTASASQFCYDYSTYHNYGSRVGATLISYNSTAGAFEEIFFVWDRVIVDIQSDNEYVLNNVQVSFTLTIIYEYDSMVIEDYLTRIYRDSVIWYWFTDSNYSLFIDTDASAEHNYTASYQSPYYYVENWFNMTFWYANNTETVFWSARVMILWSGAVPYDPYDTDNVTFTTLILDDYLGTSNVWLKAITAPVGFSDVYYSMSLIQDNLYTYSFSSMTVGFYAFKVIASDGYYNSTHNKDNLVVLHVRLPVESTFGEIRFAFFDTSDNWVPFETLNVNLTQSEITYILTSIVATVLTTENMTLEVFNKWDILISNTTFDYTQFKRVVLDLYELVIDNMASHKVRLDISYNGTYPNITIQLPSNFPRFLYLASANYTMIFTYYNPTASTGDIIDYELLTGYYVTYEYELIEGGYLEYTGYGMEDIMNNINYTRTSTNDNIDAVDSNIMGIKQELADDEQPVDITEIFGVMLIAVLVFTLIIIIVWGLRAILRDKKEGKITKDSKLDKDIDLDEDIEYQ